MNFAKDLRNLKLTVISDSVFEVRTSSRNVMKVQDLLAQRLAASWLAAYFDVRGGGRIEYFQAALKKRLSGLGSSERLPFGGPGSGELNAHHYMIALRSLNEAVRRDEVRPLNQKEWETLGQYLDDIKNNFQRSMLVVGGGPVYWGYHADRHHVCTELTENLRTTCNGRGVIFTNPLRFFEYIGDCKVCRPDDVKGGKC